MFYSLTIVIPRWAWKKNLCSPSSRKCDTYTLIPLWLVNAIHIGFSVSTCDQKIQLIPSIMGLILDSFLAVSAALCIFVRVSYYLRAQDSQGLSYRDVLVLKISFKELSFASVTSHPSPHPPYCSGCGSEGHHQRIFRESVVALSK